ncbi:translation initiation factor IF-2 [Candidatus Micrarchaeota archaeon]|nr:translation initiation factor IF-2 [Candidatus Micrarchaeota archaeon]
MLDSIRNSNVTSKEAGGITQHIGASEVPISTIRRICAGPLAKSRTSLAIPGLLFIDTPGHEVFSNLRRRGGSIADIAILVIDATKGIEAQTVEAIEILREYRTPFVIAFTKVDALSGWIAHDSASIAESLKLQRQDVADSLDQRIYSLIGGLYEFKLNAERFDRVADFTKQIAIIPVSAKTREGLPELLMFVSGLAQKFLEGRLALEENAEGRASVLEVREERGLGSTIDCILYQGSIREGDSIVFASLSGPVQSKVKALLRPEVSPASSRSFAPRFISVGEVVAAAGIKLTCERAEEAVAGSTLQVVRGEAQARKATDAIAQEVREIVFESDNDGVIIYADALGSLEAITKMFSARKIPVRHAGVGKPSKRDVMEAESVAAGDRFLGVIFSFNQKVDADVTALAVEKGVKLFEEKIIYNLVEGYERWVAEEKAGSKREAFANLVTPSKFVVLKDHCFRVSKPCVLGVEILEGTLKSGSRILNASGEEIGELKQIQRDKSAVPTARKGEQVAVSIEGPTFGRQVNYGDTLYTDVPKDDQLELEGKYRPALSEEEHGLLKDIKRLKGLRVF